MCRKARAAKRSVNDRDGNAELGNLHPGVVSEGAVAGLAKSRRLQHTVVPRGVHQSHAFPIISSQTTL